MAKKEGWERGLGKFSKIREDRGWHKNIVTNSAKDAKPGNTRGPVDTSPDDKFNNAPAQARQVGKERLGR